MNTFRLRIEVENDAFQDDMVGELVRTLGKVAKQLRENGASFDRSFPVRDSYGNRVGEMKFEDDGIVLGSQTATRHGASKPRGPNRGGLPAASGGPVNPRLAAEVDATKRAERKGHKMMKWQRDGDASVSECKWCGASLTVVKVRSGYDMEGLALRERCV